MLFVFVDFVWIVVYDGCLFYLDLFGLLGVVLGLVWFWLGIRAGLVWLLEFGDCGTLFTVLWLTVVAVNSVVFGYRRCIYCGC